MAKLRRLSNVAQMLLQQHLIKQRQEQQAQAVGSRQQELAYLNDFLERGQHADFNEQDLELDTQKAALGDPTGRIGLGLQRSGKFAPPGSVRTQGELELPMMEQINKADTQVKIPDIQTLISQRAALGPIEELGPLSSTLEARTSRLGQIGKDQEAQMDRNAADEYGKRTATLTADEDSARAFHPSVLSRQLNEGQQKNRLELDLERGKNPILADRAGDVQYASTTGQQQALADFEETDPRLAGMAKTIIDNPDLLTSLPAQERARVLRKISMTADGEIVNKRRLAAKQAITDSAIAMAAIQKDMQNPLSSGFSGAVGAKGPSSLFGIMDKPMSGTNARGFTNRFDQLKATLTLPNLEKMRGFGSVALPEFETVGKAATSLDRSSPEEFFKRDFEPLKQGLIRTWTANGLDPAELQRIFDGPGGSVNVQSILDKLNAR